MTVGEYLEQGRTLAERIPYAVIALAARLAVVVRSTKYPCCRRMLRHISALSASMSFRFYSFLDSHLGFRRLAFSR
jgi:hypothetical protein